MSERASVANATAVPVPLLPRQRAGRTSLPRPLTSFVAREQEQKEVIDLLVRDDVRLLSLTGPGGTGKTRLAIRVAEELGDRFEHIWFISLASVNHPRLVLTALRQSLGMRQLDRDEMAVELSRIIGDSDALLVLDNFEQIVAAGADLSALLQGCDRLKALVTTRAILRVSGEFDYAVPPMPLPPVDAGLSHAAVESWPTIRLFIERARAVDVHFALTPTNVRDVSEICSALDGLPLAIELAAAQLRVYTTQAMKGQLCQRLDLLVDGPVDQPVRLQTMRNAIAWSYELLQPEQQALFRCIGLFTGSFTLDAVETICLGCCGSSRAGLALAGLIDSSLLQRVEHESGELRYSMLETVREFAGEMLERDPLAEVLRETYAHFYLAYAAEAETRLSVTGSADLVERLSQDRANLRAAVQWAFDHHRPELVLRLAGSLLSLAYARGEPAEGLSWLLTALESPGRASAEELSDALFTASALFQIQGNLERAIAFGERALEVSRATGYPFGEARALIGLGISAEWSNDLDAASERYQAANTILLEESPTARLPHWRALPRANLADIALIQHRHDDAVRLGEQAVAQWRTDGYLWGIAQALGTVAAAHCERGDLDAARTAYREVLDVWLACADGRGIAGTIAGIAAIPLAAGQFAQAARLLGAAESVRRHLGVEFVAHHLYAQEQVARTRAWMGELNFRAHWQDGDALGLTNAVELAREALVVGAVVSSRERTVLSRRELDVLRLVTNGLPDREIADELSISPRTVQSHVLSILTKLGARSRAEAVAIAIRSGVI